MSKNHIGCRWRCGRSTNYSLWSERSAGQTTRRGRGQMNEEEVRERLRKEFDELQRTGWRPLDSQDIRNAQIHRTEERIRVVQELRNSSLADADRCVG